MWLFWCENIIVVVIIIIITIIITIVIIIIIIFIVIVIIIIIIIIIIIVPRDARVVCAYGCVCETDSTTTIAPPKKTQLLSSTNVSWLLDMRKDAMKKNHHIFSCLQRTIEQRRRDGKGHRMSGDKAGSWFQNRRFRQRNFWGSTAERLVIGPLRCIMPTLVG